MSSGMTLDGTPRVTRGSRRTGPRTKKAKVRRHARKEIPGQKPRNRRPSRLALERMAHFNWEW